MDPPTNSSLQTEVRSTTRPPVGTEARTRTRVWERREPPSEPAVPLEPGSLTQRPLPAAPPGTPKPDDPKDNDGQPVTTNSAPVSSPNREAVLPVASNGDDVGDHHNEAETLNPFPTQGGSGN